ncbi:MAG: YceI family protein [Candidatus Pacebacteria bacterium]|jgi:polyisoprenoid-binding protein YceI|nr:YceI family protein [Candidatus Paceibacterota bacterium]
MQKNIGIVVFVIVVLVGGWYMMSANKNMEVPVVAEQENNQEAVNEVAPETQTQQKVLNIVSLESKATYDINEVLKGKKTHVTGTSQALSGTLTVDTTSNKIIGGEVKLDATSFKTDIAARDGNVKNLILKADKPGNEFIVFATTSIEGMSESVLPDTDFPIKVTGNMTIAGVTKPVTFDGMAKLGTDQSVTIKAVTTLTYADFGLAIPDFAFLANVDKTVKLSVELVAR